MFFLGLYKINGLDGNTHYMRAKQIYKKVLKDSYSDNDWVLSVSELLRICERPDFPKDYGDKIKICILKYFANIESYKKDIPKCHMQIGTNTAVKDCYNSMRFSKNEKVISARKKYFEAILDSVIHSFDTITIPKQFKDTYKQVCKEWKKSMFEEYFENQPIKDIEKMKRLLKIELHDTIKKSIGQEILEWANEKKIIQSRGLGASQQNSINKER